MKYSDEVKALARECMDVYGADDGGLHFNVLVTQRCPFECAHCLNNSGPAMPRTTFSVQDARDLVTMDAKVREFFGNADACGLSFNLIGGEPTLYIDALRDLLAEFEPHGHLEMTTNGWWLRSAASFVRTMKVLDPYIQDMPIRLSHSPYHRAFRTTDDDVIRAMVSVQGSSRGYGSTWEDHVDEDQPESGPLERIIRPALESAVSKLGESVGLCPECNARVSITSSCVECDACGHSYEADGEYDQVYEKARRQLCDLYACATSFIRAWKTNMLGVETQNGEALATGRAGPAHNQCGTKGGMCYAGDRMFTVAPGGVIQDMCCSGVPIGTMPAGYVSEGVVAAIRRVQMVRLINKRFHGRGACSIRARELSFNACTNCDKSIRSVVRGRSCREEVDSTIRYLKNYGKRINR